jgi:hypothetical protein
MSAFSSMAAAEARARALVKSGVWLYAHAQRNFNGVISVRVVRPMAPTNATTRAHGAWVSITDDSQT